MSAMIEHLQLVPHPEGGHYREVFRSTATVVRGADGAVRSALTGIHFLLRKGERSRLHRVESEEVWHHAAGGAMELLLLDAALSVHQRHVLGPLERGHVPFVVVPAGWWQAARPVDADSLCSCFVGPGFEFADLRFMDDAADRERMQRSWPGLVALI